MAITLEDILLERERNRKNAESTFPPLSPTKMSDEEELNDLRAYVNARKPLVSAPTETMERSGNFPLSNIGDIASSVGRAYTSGLEVLGGGKYGENVGPINPISSEIEARRRGIVGLGEAALSVGSGLASFPAAAFRIGKEYLENPPRPFPSLFEEYEGGEVAPDYWEKFVKKAKDIHAEMTYEPRTEEGRYVASLINKPMEWISEASRMASEAPLMRMAFNEDQRKAVAYVHELISMIAIGELGGLAIRSIGRERIAKFKKGFIDAAKEPESGGPKTEALGRIAEEIRDKAANTPEIAERFSPERVERLRQAQREQGFSTLDKSLEEMERIRLSERDPIIIDRIKREGQSVLDRLNENPENTQYQVRAVNFFEKTRGSGDVEIDALRQRVNEAMGGISEPTLSPSVGVREPVNPPYARGITREVPGDIEGNRLQARIDTLQEDMEAGTSARENIQRGIESFSSPTPAITPSKKSQIPPKDITPLEVENFEKGLSDLQPEITAKNIADARIRGEITPEIARARLKSLDAYQRGETGPPEWLVEGMRDEAKATEATLNEIKGNQSRGKPANISTESALSALEESNSFATRESTIAKIQESYLSGKDISEEIYNAISGKERAEAAVQAYKNGLTIARKGIEESRPRNLIDIIKDVVQLFAFETHPGGEQLGALGSLSLSFKQKLAAQNLWADAQKQFHKFGKTLDQYIEEQGFSEPFKYALKDYFNTIPKISPPNGVGPKNMSIDGKGMTTDPIVERHIHTIDGKDYLYPPQYFEAMKAFQNANVIPQSEFSRNWSLETSSRIARRYGQDIHDMMFPRAREARKAAKIEVEEMRRDLRSLEKIVNNKERLALTDAVEKGDLSSLPANLREVYDILESGYAETLYRIDEVRRAIGLDPLPSIDNPVQFSRAVNSARSNGIGVNLATSSSKQIRSVMDSYGEFQPRIEPKQTFTQKRFGISGQKDIFRQYNDFSTTAFDSIHMSPLTAALREHVRGSRLDVIAMDGSQYNIGKSNPGLKTFIEDWTNFVDGTNPLVTKFDRQLRGFNENMSWALLSANLRSVIAQPSSLINTYYKVGGEHFIGALNDSLSSVLSKNNARKTAIEESYALSSRNEADMYEGFSGRTGEGFRRDAARGLRESKAAISEGRMRDFTRDIAQIGMYGLEAADFEAAVITYNAFKRQGIAKGLKGEELIRYADQGVIDTQASGWRGDLSPIQRHALGRTLMQFQTFTISDANFLWNEIIKPAKSQPYSETLKNVGRFVGIVTAYNTIADALGIDPPTPNILTPSIRGMISGGSPFKGTVARSIEKGDDPLKFALKLGAEIAGPYTPGLGAAFKYGKGVGGPTLGMAVELGESLLDRPGAKSPLEPISKLAGIPFSSQYWRYHRGDPEATITQRLLNFQPTETGSSGNSRSGLKGGLGGKLGSGLK